MTKGHRAGWSNGNPALRGRADDATAAPTGTPGPKYQIQAMTAKRLELLSELVPRGVRPHVPPVLLAQADGTFFIAQAYHCAVGTKPD